MRFYGISTVLVPGLALLDAVSASLVHVTSYAGKLTTLNLTAPSEGISAQSTLGALSVSQDCGAQPSWLTLVSGILYCVNENFNGNNGTLTSFQVGAGGQLELLSNLSTIKGPVASVVYGLGKGMAIADYAGGGLNTFNITDPTAVVPVQSDIFQLPHKGVNASRQDIPHPHETILDPTGNFLAVPDLGSDLVRIFSLDNTTLRYTEIAPLVARPGSGPRHGVFAVGTNKTFFYLVHELDNSFAAFEVIYNANKTLGFSQIYDQSTHGSPEKPPDSAKAAEIALSPDGRFITISSRSEGQIMIPNFDPNNSTTIPSDPLITFKLDLATGVPSFLQSRAAGGMNPRQFSFNKDGSLIGVGLQDDGRAVIIARDVNSGLMGDFVANVAVDQVTCVIFNEE